jgi:hypothetical protein
VTGRILTMAGMRSATVSERAQAWVVDYSAARMRALRWLGDRYLLAKPINARETTWRVGTPRELLSARK